VPSDDLVAAIVERNHGDRLDDAVRFHRRDHLLDVLQSLALVVGVFGEPIDQDHETCAPDGVVAGMASRRLLAHQLQPALRWW
jgi:hypothetical protein